MVIDNFQREIDRQNIEKTNKILNTLPPYIKDFFASRRVNTSTRTRLSYAYDIKRFFQWLQDSTPELSSLQLKEISIDTLNSLNTRDIEEYVNYLMLCKENTNSEAGVARKLASLGSMFNYFIKHEMIDKNPCVNVDKPKIHNQEIVVLTPDEINRMLDTVQFGSKSFTPKQESYLSKTRFRDYVMISLMLTTGIRVSELVGLDLDDFFLDEYKMVVRRKGGDRTSVYLSDETCDLLKDYMNIRKENKKVSEGEKALFLSLQGKRICVQAVEDMVKKYTVAAGINKPITPHKFRKTFGTELYRETNDIYLVADALNHKSVTTTTKFYAAQSQENLKQARNIMKLNIKKEPRE